MYYDQFRQFDLSLSKGLWYTVNTARYTHTVYCGLAVWYLVGRVWYANVVLTVLPGLFTTCFYNYTSITQYLICTAPPDVEQFNRALCLITKLPFHHTIRLIFTQSINVRPDMRVSRGRVFAVDSNHKEAEQIVKGGRQSYLTRYYS